MRYYLDTSAMVKRYIVEPGSDYIDGIFNSSFTGSDVVVTSYWNIGEAATVFDKFERRSKSTIAEKLLELMLDEFDYLSRSQMIELEGVSNSLLQEVIKMVIKHHIYISDALQIATAKKVNTDIFLSSDRGLLCAASAEGMKTTQVG
jgi:predicted nucleic acid-binding protein